MIAADVVGAYSVAGVAIIGAAVGYGRLNQKVADMGKRVEAAEGKQEKQDSRLSEGAVTFEKINGGIARVESSQEDIKSLLRTMSDRLDRHIDAVPR